MRFRFKSVCALGLFVLIFLILPPKLQAAVWKFEWTNTTVHIPVGDSIEKYKSIPKAQLYKDGRLCSDAEVTYNTEGDWLYYFKDIDTSKTGNYLVWYKAYDAVNSPGTCTGYKSLITFSVEDQVPPSVEVYSDVVQVKRGNEYDLTKNFYAYDNYELKDVTVTESLNTKKVGEYPVEIVATDTSNNQTKASFTVLVYETSAPVITCSEVGDIIEIPLNQDYDIKSRFTAYDSVDGDITDKIVFPPLDNTFLGKYSYTVSVKNDADLETFYTVTVSVVDDEPPVLELTSHAILLDYDIDIDSIDFMKYIKTLSDNTDIDYDNLSITHNLRNKIGSYSIWYSYTDGVYTVSDMIDVTMITEAKPVITVADTITVSVNSNINLLDYITVTDDSDPYVANSIEIYDDEVDYTEEGTYYAEVYAMNSSGLSSTVRFKIVVEDESWFSETNTPISVSLIAVSVIALGLITFILVYFVLKKVGRK